jgi:hypothetical protein
MIALSCNEITHLFAALVIGPSVMCRTGCVGHRGDDDIRPAPGPAITDGKPPGSREHYELRRLLIVRPDQPTRPRPPPRATDHPQRSSPRHYPFQGRN